MKTLSKGELVCFIPSAMQLADCKPPIVGIVMADWSEDEHGDIVEVYWTSFGYLTKDNSSYYIQRLKDYGTHVR